MRAILGGGIALVLGFGVVADAAAQARAAGGRPAAAAPGLGGPRVVVPPAPAAGARAAAPATQTPGLSGPRVVVPPAPAPGGRAAAPAIQGPASNPLRTTQDVRIVTPGRPDTRVIVRERPATGSSDTPGLVGAAGRTPREVRVIVEEDAGPGAPPERRETRIIIKHPNEDLPGADPIIVILE